MEMRQCEKDIGNSYHTRTNLTGNTHVGLTIIRDGKSISVVTGGLQGELKFNGGKNMDKDKKCIDCAIWKSYGMDLRYCKHLIDLGFEYETLYDAREREICNYFVEYDDDLEN